MKLANLDGRATLVRPAAGAIDVAKASDGEFGPDIQSLYAGIGTIRNRFVCGER
jgi:hypothetical protein